MSRLADAGATSAALDARVDAIDAILPQTQCRKCGFGGCRPYAEAIVQGRADIDQCPPGGEQGVRRLADLLGREFKPLDPAYGSETQKAFAVIDEQACIGCTLCIQACPVDAIVGAAKQMHTVIEALCTGCDLCLAPCPVDCITMQPVEGDRPRQARTPMHDPEAAFAAAARERFRWRNLRLEREAQEKDRRLAAKSASARQMTHETALAHLTDERKNALVAAAIERAQAQRAAGQPKNTGTTGPDRR